MRSGLLPAMLHVEHGFGGLRPRCLILVAAAGLVLGLEPVRAAEEETQVVDPTAIHAFFAGHTVYGRNLMFGVTEFRWSEYHCPNGRSLYVRGTDLFFGKWRVAGDEVCFVYPELNGGEDNCFHLFDLGGEKHNVVVSNGAQDGFTVEIDGRLAGDPFNIQKLTGAGCTDQTS